ncbi:MAG TPA: efflux RND transporter periplasmic adaptor subunit [Burkholderiaceae bacterium]|nr:efflux RND transporter periplasmic adaptor subunit [Burkholderiaceae bacterium]
MQARASVYGAAVQALLLGLMLAAGALLGGCEGKSKAHKAEQAVPVVLAPVEVRDVPREIEAFGVVEASSTVSVLPQVQGLVTEVHFKEGDFVKQGDLLFTIDTRPYRASLAAAQAELARNKAIAAQAKLEAERSARLRSEGVASDQEVARAEADAASSAANVKVGQAQIASANLNVAFTRVTAPIDGRTGSLLVHAGNVVHAGEGQPLVVIRSVSPVQVRFSVPEQYVPEIREKMRNGSLLVRATPRGAGAKAAEGPLTFLENAVDSSTGTISLKATFTNADQSLWPGAAVDVVLVLGVDAQATVVPEPALQRSQGGTTVFAVGKDGRAETHRVEVLRTTDTLALIRSDLEAGDQVVTDGQLRLRQGTKVSPKPMASPPAAHEALP